MRPVLARDELRLLGVRSLQGASYWAPWPVTRVDLSIGAFEGISSADRVSLTDALVVALPGLMEHRCSVGVRGGFVLRLEQGTYAAHIVEHVALELQSMIGHEVGFGRARGTDVPGEYTVVLEHRHAVVGRRAAMLALRIVRRAFDGLRLQMDAAEQELRTLAARPDLPTPAARVFCGVLGGADRFLAARELRRRLALAGPIAPTAPSALMTKGLPFRASGNAIILEADPGENSERRQDPDGMLRSASAIADAVVAGGLIVVPDSEPELRNRLARSGRRLATFTTAVVDREDLPAGVAARGSVSNGRILVRTPEGSIDAGRVFGRTPMGGEIAAAVVAAMVRERPSASKGSSSGRQRRAVGAQSS